MHTSNGINKAVSILERTRVAFGDDLLCELGSRSHCIVGCGGTGANFAEMLVRSGALEVTLIDGAIIKDTDLNRITSFSSDDIEKRKVEALKERLIFISPNVKILSLADNFRRPENLLPEYPIGQQVRDAVHDSDVVFIATDTNLSRFAIESLCRDADITHFLSCGVHIEDEFSCFECSWRPRTPKSLLDREGYGPKNASYASIVQEAASISFMMLLNHLKSSQGNGNFKYYFRKYDASFTPIQTCVNKRPSSNIFSP